MPNLTAQKLSLGQELNKISHTIKKARRNTAGVLGLEQHHVTNVGATLNLNMLGKNPKPYNISHVCQ